MEVILEGTDAVGKTTAIQFLTRLMPDHTFRDRERTVISPMMVFSLTTEDRGKAYSEFLKHNEVFVIFLINNDGEELLRRVKSREKISDFDLDAPRYNTMYLYTYKYMENNDLLHNKMAMVDVTGMTELAKVHAIRECIRELEKKYAANEVKDGKVGQ